MIGRRGKLRRLGFGAAALLALPSTSMPIAHADAGCNAAHAELGRRVLAVDRALRAPDAPGAMQAVVDLGTDSRFYTLVRGWLLMQLQGDKSVLTATGRDRPGLEARIAFVRDAIRAIDLE